MQENASVNKIMDVMQATLTIARYCDIDRRELAVMAAMLFVGNSICLGREVEDLMNFVEEMYHHLKRYGTAKNYAI